MLHTPVYTQTHHSCTHLHYPPQPKHTHRHPECKRHNARHAPYPCCTLHPPHTPSTQRNTTATLTSPCTLPPPPTSFIYIFTPTPTHSSTHTFTPQPAFLEKSRAAAGGEAARRWGQPVLGGEKEAPRAHSLAVARELPRLLGRERGRGGGKGAEEDQGVRRRGSEGGAVGVGAEIRASPRYPRAESAPPAPASEMLTGPLCPQG